MIDYMWLIITVLAGGTAAFSFGKSPKWLPYLVSFSGAYLFAVIVFHLLPEIYSGETEHAHHHASVKITGAFLLAGLLFQMLLEYFSHGVAHAHSHKDAHPLTAGAVSGLFLHAFTEGLPVHQLNDHAYLYGILVHKFPIAVVLTSFLLQSGLSATRSFIILFLFALMTPAGTYAGEKIPFLTENHIYVSAFVTGILTHIGTVIIFESDTRHEIPLKKLIVMILAFILAYFN